MKGFQLDIRRRRLLCWLKASKCDKISNISVEYEKVIFKSERKEQLCDMIRDNIEWFRHKKSTRKMPTRKCQLIRRLRRYYSSVWTSEDIIFMTVLGSNSSSSFEIASRFVWVSVSLAAVLKCQSSSQNNFWRNFDHIRKPETNREHFRV